jgi:hypothetical protein
MLRLKGSEWEEKKKPKSAPILIFLSSLIFLVQPTSTVYSNHISKPEDTAECVFLCALKTLCRLLPQGRTTQSNFHQRKWVWENIQNLVHYKRKKFYFFLTLDFSLFPIHPLAKWAEY